MMSAFLQTIYQILGVVPFIKDKGDPSFIAGTGVYLLIQGIEYLVNDPAVMLIGRIQAEKEGYPPIPVNRQGKPYVPEIVFHGF